MKTLTIILTDGPYIPNTLKLPENLFCFIGQANFIQGLLFRDCYSGIVEAGTVTKLVNSMP
ncbi:hypothetical protein ACSAZL_02325 [Methanosarcina sp. T3]|uniref:hypothetical protein n=1 Tax=Methanosarcina sp. T3 TaxID=3439062 RepID=UPI003F84DA17